MPPLSLGGGGVFGEISASVKMRAFNIVILLFWIECIAHEEKVMSINESNLLD